MTADSEDDSVSVHDEFPAVEEQDEGKATLPLNDQDVEKAVSDGLTTEQQATANDVETEAPGEIMEES